MTPVEGRGGVEGQAHGLCWQPHLPPAQAAPALHPPVAPSRQIMGQMKPQLPISPPGPGGLPLPSSLVSRLSSLQLLHSPIHPPVHSCSQLPSAHLVSHLCQRGACPPVSSTATVSNRLPIRPPVHGRQKALCQTCCVVQRAPPGRRATPAHPSPPIQPSLLPPPPRAQRPPPAPIAFSRLAPSDRLCLCCCPLCLAVPPRRPSPVARCPPQSQSQSSSYFLTARQRQALSSPPAHKNSRVIRSRAQLAQLQLPQLRRHWPSRRPQSRALAALARLSL